MKTEGKFLKFTHFPKVPKGLLWSTLALFTVLSLASCNKCKDEDGCCDDDCPTQYDVPTTYAFENVSYNGQTERIEMLEEMTAYMKTANTIGIGLDATKLKEMYANEGNHFTVQSSKDLKSKTFVLDVDSFEVYMERLATASQSSQAGSNGVAGIVTSTDASKSYLCDENGIEWTQLIEKGLFGAVFYYQATAWYLSDDQIGDGVDNTEVEAGKGTDMEHHWDEAFGYLGVPTDFPGNADGLKAHGKYCNGRDAVLGTNSKLMNAFILGRAAISGKDMETKNAQVPIIRDQWERVIAGTVIHYLNGGISDFGDDALRNHQLSEAIAFTMNLKYNPTKKITDAQIQQVLDDIGTNLYEVTIANLNQAKDLLAAVYGMESVKDQL